MTHSEDERYMLAATRLAVRHAGWTAANPSVACLIVSGPPGARIISGIGVTALGGRPHAEPIALNMAGAAAMGATAYVTLEPCAHHGRTPPCARSLIEAGIARVVTAVVDPDHRVNNLGHELLRDASIEVEQGICKLVAQRDLMPYLKHKNERRPYVTLKLAITPQGLMGVRGVGQFPITGAVSKSQSHVMRARHNAILVGIGTVLEDNPLLTCRLPGLEHHSPARIVLDPKNRMTGEENIAAGGRQSGTFIVTPGSSVDQNRATAGGCQHIACEIVDGRVALPELLDDLAARGMMRLLVEGGASVAASFLNEGLVDEIQLFVAASAVIPERGEKVMSPVVPDSIPSAFEKFDQIQLGPDLLLKYRKAG